MNHEELIITVSLISTVNQFDPEKKIINVPYIRIQGDWLEKLGFSKGGNVAVIGGGNDSELRLRVVEAEG